MERLHKLLFELSSPERISIMSKLEKDECKLSQLSRKLQLTVTETSRHLQRLNEAKLIQKNSNGKYGLTQFGRLAMFLLEDLSFLLAHREYFLEYDASGVPRQFIDRFGELAHGVYVGEALGNLEEGENRIREAQKFVWILSDAVLTNSVPILMEKVKKPFDLRIVLPEGKFPPENASRLPLASNTHKRVLPKIDVLIVMTESYAVFCLPTWSGKIDYTGFSGQDARFRKWCRDLFLYYWERAKPVTS